MAKRKKIAWDSSDSSDDEMIVSSSPDENSDSQTSMFTFDEVIEYIPVLQKMLQQEKSSLVRSEMDTVLNLLQENEPAFREDIITVRDKIDKWVIDRPPQPPEVKNLKVEKKDGKLIATWTPPDWPLPLLYSGRCSESSGRRNVVDSFVNATETSYAISNVSPIQYYIVAVWAVDQKNEKGEEMRSKREMLCKKIGDVFVDDTTQLRKGYPVYKGYLKSASTDLDPVAVKIVTAETPREVKALQKIKHNNVVTYRVSGRLGETRSIGKQLYIAMELCRIETFWEMVIERRIDMICSKLSLLHMMLGLDAIHRADILHRDLKPQNILCSLSGRIMKIADFGLSKLKDPNKSKVSKSVLEIGTEGWGSPEHYEKDAEMSDKSDIFSAGLIFHFGLSCGKHVYGDEAHQWKTRIIKGYPVNLSGLACSDVQIAKDLISKMLKRQPPSRPTAAEVLAHPFFWDYRRKLVFLHQMSAYLTPVVLRHRDPSTMTQDIIDDLASKKGFLSTVLDEDWVKQMEESSGVRNGYSHVLKVAKGEVKPYTKYNPRSIFDLIRFIGNIEEHYRDEELWREFRESEQNVWKLFYRCFPDLLCTIYNAVRKQWPQIRRCSDFPSDAIEFFTKPAIFQPLSSHKKK